MIKSLPIQKENKSENKVNGNVVIKIGDLSRIGKKKFRKIEFVKIPESFERQLKDKEPITLNNTIP